MRVSQTHTCVSTLELVMYWVYLHCFLHKRIHYIRIGYNCYYTWGLGKQYLYDVWINRLLWKCMFYRISYDWSHQGSLRPRFTDSWPCACGLSDADRIDFIAEFINILIKWLLILLHIFILAIISTVILCSCLYYWHSGIAWVLSSLLIIIYFLFVRLHRSTVHTGSQNSSLLTITKPPFIE